MNAELPAAAVNQFVGLVQHGCSLQAGWMAAGLPWDQWRLFRRAYRATEPSAWSELIHRARQARGQALAVAWTDLRKEDSARWLILNRQNPRTVQQTQDCWFQPVPASVGATIQEILSVVTQQPDVRDPLIASIEGQPAAETGMDNPELNALLASLDSASSPAGPET